MNMTSHHINSCPIYLTINSQPWIPAGTKARLLEWKIRYDLMEYVAVGVPELSVDQIKAYQPKNQGTTSIAGKSPCKTYRQIWGHVGRMWQADRPSQRSHQRSR